MIDRVTARLLRAHLGDGAEHRTCPCEACIGVGYLGDSEIQNLHVATRRHHDVGGLDVAVHHTSRMGMFQAASDLQGVLQCLRHRQQPSRDFLFERFTLVVGHDDDELPGLRLRHLTHALDDLGGLRFDLGIMAHAHTTWVSDVVDPIASVALGYGCTVQFAPEVCNHWMVGDTDSGVVDSTRPQGWWDFMLRVPMNGQFGISGRIPEWSAAVRERVAANVALYRRIRGTIVGADVYHLTPAPRRIDPTGWTAVEYVQPGGRRGVVLAYRLARSPAAETLRLRGLLPRATYDVVVDGHRLAPATGADLASRGLRYDFRRSGARRSSSWRRDNSGRPALQGQSGRLPLRSWPARRRETALSSASG